MIPYLVLLAAAFIFCFVAKEKGKPRYMIATGEVVSRSNFAVPIFFVLLWLLLAFRSVDVGKDTSNYQYYFEKYSNQSREQLLDGSPEFLFRFLNWLVGQVTDNFQIYLAIVAAINVIPIAVLYAKDRRHSYLKIVLFVNMSVFIMLFSGIRQFLAMSIGLIAFHFVQRKRPVVFLMWVVVAISFHSSAFMLLAMYPLYYFRLKKRHLLIIAPAIVCVYVFNAWIFAGLLRIMSLLAPQFNDYQPSNTGAVTMIILFVMFTLFAFVIPDENETNDDFIGMRNYLLLATLLQCFAPLHPLAMRMNYYYILFVPVVLPMTLNYAETGCESR